MSKYIQWLEVKEGQRYLFHFAFDSAPMQDELDQAQRDILDVLAAQNVESDRVGVAGFKCLMGTPALFFPCSPIRGGGRYLVAALILVEDGGFTEDPTKVAKRVATAFSRFANTPLSNVSAIVLENTGLAVDVTEDDNALPLGA